MPDVPRYGSLHKPVNAMTACPCTNYSLRESRTLRFLRFLVAGVTSTSESPSELCFLRPGPGPARRTYFRLPPRADASFFTIRPGPVHDQVMSE